MFRDQHAVITGGSSGLGLELPRMLADGGIDVLINNAGILREGRPGGR